MSRANRDRRRAEDRERAQLDAVPWTPFEPAELVGYELLEGESAWQNNLFTVIRRRWVTPGQDRVGLHLSIRRLDRQPIHDWRALQRIKSALLGPEQEMAELYPAESRVQDTANQTHLWGLEGVPVPFGFFQARAVAEGGPESPPLCQRPFPDHHRPPDLRATTPEEIARALAVRPRR